MKNIFYTLILVLGMTAQVQGQDKQEIQAVIETFFEGLESGDSSVVSKTIASNIIMETIFKSRQGLEQRKRMDRKQFLNGVASKKPEDVYQERLLSYSIHVDGSLASVWTPYEFYYNKEFSHCGSNSFQMVRRNGTWEIVYIIDVRKRSDCKKS